MTIQTEEKIIINNKKFELLSRPFEPFLKALDINLIPFGSYCWRGYVCEWTIINNVLYLTHIKLHYDPKDEEKLKPLLLDEVIYRATWYSGELIIALVEPTWYHPSYQPVYSREMHLTVENGLVINHKIVENKVPDIEYNDQLF